MDRWIYERSSGWPGYRCNVCNTWIHSIDDRVCKCDNNEKDIIMKLINAGFKDTDFNKAERLLRGGEIFSLGDRNELVIHYDASFLPYASPYRYGNVPLDSSWKHLSRWMMEERIQFPCLCWVSDTISNPGYSDSAAIAIVTHFDKENECYKSHARLRYWYITPLTKEELDKYVPSR